MDGCSDTILIFREGDVREKFGEKKESKALELLLNSVKYILNYNWEKDIYTKVNLTVQLISVKTNCITKRKTK